jgi:hypothetical protein
VEKWQAVSAAGRRRRLFFDRNEVLAAFIASASDIDDLIPILTAYEIEWNKINALLTQSGAAVRLAEYAVRGTPLTEEERNKLAWDLRISLTELGTLESIWGPAWISNLQAIAAANKEFALRLLAGSLVDYHKATQRWWDNVARHAGGLLDGRPVYFVSSNMHSLANLVSGHALTREEELIDYINDMGNESLMEEYTAIQSEETRSSKENFLYYVLKKYTGDPKNAESVQARIASEAEVGLTTIPSDRYLDVGSQIIELNRLIPDRLDPRLPRDGIEKLRNSRAVILNIDYPLGLAAYQLFSQVSQNVDEIKGFYLTGKSATLNGRIGDVIIPNVVYDEHSQNTYLFNNCFSARNVAPYLVYGSVLDNQKAICVKGTFLQNRRFIELFYREGYTDIEMEAGPYLSALYEMSYPKRYPMDEIVRLYQTDFDIGFLHYASDTPYIKGKNLGAVHPAYYGMDPTYATALAILRRIIEREAEG